jgi:hypothetical protein
MVTSRKGSTLIIPIVAAVLILSGLVVHSVFADASSTGGAASGTQNPVVVVVDMGSYATGTLPTSTSGNGGVSGQDVLFSNTTSSTSGITSSTIDGTASSTASSTAPTATSTASSTIPAPVHIPTLAESEATVRAYFSDIPVMIAVAKCESSFREFNDNGTVMHGGYGNSMVGIYQIDPSVHRAKALSLGFNIDTIDGNIGYARYLYNHLGTTPWLSSFSCWNSAYSTSGDPTPTSGNGGTGTSGGPLLNIDLVLGVTDSQVFTLQQLLNHAGFTLAVSGPGSSGNETTKFGSLTRAAVRKFQCAQGIACSGDEYSTGYGFVNAATRAKLLAVAASSGSSTGIGDNNPAQIDALKAQIATLVAMVAQLQAQLAARLAVSGGH